MHSREYIECVWTLYFINWVYSTHASETLTQLLFCASRDLWVTTLAFIISKKNISPVIYNFFLFLWRTCFTFSLPQLLKHKIIFNHNVFAEANIQKCTFWGYGLGIIMTSVKSKTHTQLQNWWLINIPLNEVKHVEVEPSSAN